MIVREKAENWLENMNLSMDDRTFEKLVILLKEQDRDTRHACAEAVLSCREVCETPTGDSAISPDDAHEAVLNCRGGVE